RRPARSASRTRSSSARWPRPASASIARRSPISPSTIRTPSRPSPAKLQPSPRSAMPDWDTLLAEALADLRARTSEADIRESQAAWIRRVNDLLKRLPELPKEERKDFGVRANATKREIEAETQRLLAVLSARARQRDLERVVDVTMPGRAQPP